MSINECNRLLSIYGNNCDQTNFFDYVFDKIISKDVKDRFVCKSKDSIDIIPKESPCVKVIPVHKEIDMENLDIAVEMQKAKELVMSNSEFLNIYFVYPKNENFTRHIEVRDRDLEAASKDYRIKLIPYSLNSLCRKKGSCNGTKCS